MHQTPRAPPRTASPALSQQTNPTRTNNQRDPGSPGSGPPSRPGSRAQERTSTGAGGGNRGDGGPTRDSIKKLDQIIQNIYSKAGTVILQTRMQVTPILVGKSLERRTSRWIQFQLDTDDIDDFREEFRVWKQCGGFENRPPPLVIETYLDTTRLKGGQSLVILDENGKRWDVIEALNAFDQSGDGSSGRQGKPITRLVLERWRVELKGKPPDQLDDFGLLLPTVYKKAIVLMRSIYTTTGLLPAWKLARNSKTKGTHPALAVRCRVFSGESPTYGSDSLRIPLFAGRGDVSTDYVFGNLEVPVGRFYVSVSYRNHCNFQVVDSESLLSSRIDISDDMFKPSLPRHGHGRRDSYAPEVGSLPYHRHVQNITENQQRYGSLSTFHGEGPIGTSPISALKAVKAPGSDTSSPPDSRPASIEAPPHTLPIANHARRPSLRGIDTSRRPSVSFQSSPFKHGSLSGSPALRPQDPDVPPSPQSLNRPSSFNTHVRNRSSLTAGMPASLRGAPPPAPADNSLASSPRPSVSNRFSSSFGHRRSRPSLSGARVDDDQNSSGKQSLSSSVVQPGSGLLNEIGAAGSSGSFQTDDESIQNFLKMIESKKTLASFDSSKKGESATKRTAAQLSKFQHMRESNNALTESMNSSMQLQRSSSSSSRQLANVPGMSTSSSPGKPLSPHTPHTPAIPSRLSENSSVDYAPTTRVASRSRNVEGLPEEPTVSAQATHEGTTAIDIPTSPRPYPHARRSSSVAHQNRALVDDDDIDAHRSISLGAEDREPPSLSVLLGLGSDEPTSAVDTPGLQSAADIRATSPPDMLGQESESVEREVRPPGGLYSGFSSSPYSRRYGNNAGRGITPPHSGSGSLVGSSGRFGRGYSRGGATGLGVTGAAADEPDDEPLLFDMSEITREQSRRSLEEARGGGSVGSSGDKGAYETSHRSRRW
ncbi:autophagy-related protein 13-domain-containing protein [Annulohypoxylon maeteangense]|uniref:autophagy-related protein 13-domain-containing protein n=1 Tax=Annulohypoxylon maeteangense TaxID=1927788 RepID=UPI0020076198|nr:autophagy-related protein 13-domain-containing protein [Annulohypoxylon maeteangense]KAI0888155.1 autophagy-related protein 13-domain-containing protein [Annulohypoxylon maeteangense]